MPQTALLETVCSTQLAFIQMAATHSKPSDVGPLLKPQADAIQAVMEAKEKLGKGKDGREWGTCLSVVADGVPAWGWVQLVSSLVYLRGDSSDWTSNKGESPDRLCRGNEECLSVLGQQE